MVDAVYWCQLVQGQIMTTTFTRIVCLANSRKMSGRCIAGKELFPEGQPGAWVRPVSHRDNQEVSEYERQYEDGSDPRVLDVIKVPLLKAQPRDYQRENWLLDPGYYWERVRRVAPNELAGFTDPEAPLWIDRHSSAKGMNDRVPLPDANSLASSLRLIRVDQLELSVSQPGRDFGNYRRTVQGRFHYAGTEYWLRVTDPIYERRYLQRRDGDYQIGARFVTVSLGEAYQGYSYKLIAAIIEP